MLQFRPMNSDGPMYAPHRDLAYCGIDVIQSGINCMEFLLRCGSDELRQFLKEQEVDENKLSQVIIQLGTTLAEAYQKPSAEAQARTLEKLINEGEIPVRLFILSCIGLSFLFSVLHGIRDVMFNKELPEDLKAFAKETANYMFKNIPCRRPLYRCIYDKLCYTTKNFVTKVLDHLYNAVDDKDTEATDSRELKDKEHEDSRG